MEVRFVSRNKHKLAEARAILGAVNVHVIGSELAIHEIQTTDTKSLVRDKLLKAYRKVGRPLFVEHTGLYLHRLGGLPGGLTQIFWDTLQADRFSELFGIEPNNDAVAKTTIAHCDGRKIEIFSGDVSGQIVHPPRGPREFQWDCVFQPAGYDKTFAEMGQKKNEISMRRVALDALAGFLGGAGHA